MADAFSVPRCIDVASVPTTLEGAEAAAADATVVSVVDDKAEVADSDEAEDVALAAALGVMSAVKEVAFTTLHAVSSGTTTVASLVRVGGLKVSVARGSGKDGLSASVDAGKAGSVEGFPVIRDGSSTPVLVAFGAVFDGS